MSEYVPRHQYEVTETVRLMTEDGAIEIPVNTIMTVALVPSSSDPSILRSVFSWIERGGVRTERLPIEVLNELAGLYGAKSGFQVWGHIRDLGALRE